MIGNLTVALGWLVLLRTFSVPQGSLRDEATHELQAGWGSSP